MKVTNWRRKLAASLVAGGLLSPSALLAANLNVNLVANPSFEDVGPTTCCFTATEVLNWNDGTQKGFAYSSGQGYDAGGPLTGGGTFYFTANADNGIADVTMPGQVSQNIDVSTGSTATQIASGEAAVRISAFFTSYLTDGDIGNLHVEFFNAGGTSLGFSQISAKSPITAWKQESTAAFLPVGTTRLRASVFGTPISFGPDGYIDLVDVQVTQAANELLYLDVNTTTGQVAIKNQTGDPFHLDFYEIKSAGSANGDYSNDGKVDAADYTIWRDKLGSSATLPNDATPGSVTAADYDVWKAAFGSGSGSLDVTDWNSLQEQNLASFPAGNGSGNGWEQAGGSSSSVLSESFLTGNSLVSNGASISLGAAFNPGSPQNLEFRYGVVGDNGVGGFTGPGTFVRGFVRYVSGSGSASVVPEPATVCFVGTGLLIVVTGVRRRTT